jgi:hypothetical protein
MGFYLATKQNEILSFSGKWMELENIILSEVSQAQKAKNCMFFLIKQKKKSPYLDIFISNYQNAIFFLLSRLLFYKIGEQRWQNKFCPEAGGVGR